MRLGSSVASIELHCGDVLWTNLHPVNFCTFATYLKNTLVQINSKLHSKLYEQTLSSGRKVCITVYD